MAVVPKKLLLYRRIPPRPLRLLRHLPPSPCTTPPLALYDSSSIAASSPLALYDSFAVDNDTADPSDAAAYGLYQCRGDLRPRDCAACVAASPLALYDYSSIAASNKNYSSIAAASPLALYDSFAVGNNTADPSDAATYGLYQCRGDLRPRDCAACVAAAMNQMAVLCPDTYGGSLQLDACLLRYERFDFLGKPDTGLRFRKCGGGDGSSIDAEAGDGGGSSSRFEKLHGRNPEL